MGNSDTAGVVPDYYVEHKANAQALREGREMPFPNANAGVFGEDRQRKA
jgi:hypothetical protein